MQDFFFFFFYLDITEKTKFPASKLEFESFGRLPRWNSERSKRMFDGILGSSLSFTPGIRYSNRGFGMKFGIVLEDS